MELRATSLDPGMLYFGDIVGTRTSPVEIGSRFLSYMFQGAVWDLGRMYVILTNFGIR